MPSIEETIKEAFVIPRTIFLESRKEIGQNKALVKPSSVYFKIDWRNRTISPKPRYSLDQNFQRRLGIQLRRGLYKMYLETISAKQLDANDGRYDFIRTFSLNGLGNPPVYYFLKRYGAFPLVSTWTEKPHLRVGDERPFTYLVETQSFTEFELLGHTFGIATSDNWCLSVETYMRESTAAKTALFLGVLEVQDFDDIDLALTILSKTDAYQSWLDARRNPLLFDGGDKIE
jgi:hypothetical protein